MLGRLFSSAAGHGRGPSSLESATEEQHTRSLLFSDTPLYPSPPSQELAAGLRFGSFDDHNGFMIEEKDMRILLAQEDQERPSILFDTNLLRSRSENASPSQIPKNVPSIRHERTVSSAAPSKLYFGSQPETVISSSLRSPTSAFQTRNRSSAMSGGQNPPPSSSLRDTDSKDSDLLECMFGASSAKSGTKMHVWSKPGDKLSRVPSNPLVSPATMNGRSVRKPPLVRAQTSSLPFPTNIGYGASDMVLITRIFTVAPPELEKEASEIALNSTATLIEESEDLPERSKPSKLRESK